jgi:hypothetical protein
VVHGASDVSHRPVTNVCAGCGSIQARGTTLEMLNRIKGIFSADHVTVVSSEHSGFVHHQKGPIPPMSWVGATPSLPCSPRGE